MDQAVLALKQWLATQPGWLLIFDNADDPDALRPFLPDAGHRHILITSRAQDFQYLGIIKPVQLDQWPVDDAAAFLVKSCGREDADAGERGAAEQLARALDGLPLALEQAAAYIVASNGLTFGRYLTSYRSEGLKRLEARRPALGNYPRSVVSTWAANFDAVQKGSPAAADVLWLSAFLAPDAIPFELLTRGASELGPEAQAALGNVDEASLIIHDLLRPLGRFSLIRIDGHAETFSIHRLVQEVLKAAMDDPTCRLWAERAVRMVSKALPAAAYTNWPLCGRLLPHALSVASWIERYNMEFTEAALILNNTAIYLRERGQYGEAGPLFRQAMEICRRTLGERHPVYAIFLNNLALLYEATGLYAEAEPLYKQAIEIQRTALGEGHPGYATSLNNLALLYRLTRRYAEAEPLYKQATEIRRETLGEGHPDYAQSLNNLAELYRVMGRYGEAEPFYRQAMEIRSKALDQGHPDLAQSLNNMALLYVAMDRHSEAETLHKRAIEIRRAALDERHPDYASSLHNLAGLYVAMGCHTEAETLYKQAIEIYRTTLGEQHPSYATSSHNLAGLYFAVGRRVEAEPLYKQAVEIRRKTLGERHSSYAFSLHNLA
jgi:tetratricopeptide (TPR) repeat protein